MFSYNELICSYKHILWGCGSSVINQCECELSTWIPQIIRHWAAREVLPNTHDDVDDDDEDMRHVLVALVTYW